MHLVQDILRGTHLSIESDNVPYVPFLFAVPSCTVQQRSVSSSLFRNVLFHSIPCVQNSNIKHECKNGTVVQNRNSGTKPEQ